MTETVHNASLRMVTLLTGVALLLTSLALGWQSLIASGTFSGSLYGLNLTMDSGVGTAWLRLFWGGLSISGLVVGFFFIWLAAAQTSRRGKQIVLSGNGGNEIYGGGRVTVSLGSLHAVVVRAAERIEGVREASPRLNLKSGGWHIDCLVAVTPDSAMPAVTAILKTTLKDTLEHHTGLPVERIDIAAQLNPVRDLQRVR